MMYSQSVSMVRGADAYLRQLKENALQAEYGYISLFLHEYEASFLENTRWSSPS